jgi:hypothetical protein
MHPTAGTPAFDSVFLAAQAFVVLFLLVHDWVPLGRLSNFTAKRDADSLGNRIFVTLLPAVPAGLGLYYCAKNFAHAYPEALLILLWVTYGSFLVGMLRAWWMPYLLVPDPERAARYKEIFAGTHRFLPERNGIAPDTLHTIFHAVTLAAVVMLALR